MKFVSPKPNQTFTIDATPEWPSIAFETDATGAHSWSWTIAWRTYKRSGNATTPGNKWEPGAALTSLGGALTVRAQAGAASATVTVILKGTNPSLSGVSSYLSTKANGAGFDKLLEHETKCKHFNAQGEPIRSFDGGYGMCQLTTPAPSFEQVWNWKTNVDGGLALFAQKRGAAIAYLSQSGRTYTSDQVTYESVCRWNGGAYHVWDAKAGAWARNPNVLCDSKTGNIGWDMTDAENKGKSETDLRKRDSGAYSGGPGAGAHWKYFGVCYADRILG